MKMLDEVAIVCDHRTVESALALRGVLEHFRLRVRLHRLVEHREALDWFASHAPCCPYTVLMSMATTGEESPRLRHVPRRFRGRSALRGVRDGFR